MPEETVLIACKAPNGLVLNLDRYEKVDDKGTIIRHAGPATVTLKGWSRPINMPDPTEGGYALTPVPADFFQQWWKLNKDSSFIRDKIILPAHSAATAQARDHAAVPQMFARARPEDVPGIKAEPKAAA